jgi:hypothetical protein
MNVYNHGKIYKLIKIGEPEKALYVGSTIQTLKARYRTHEYKASDRVPVLIEDYPCDNRDQLRMREEAVRKLLKPPLNKIKCFATSEDKRECKRNFHIKHKVRQNEQSRLYHQNNIEKVHARKNAKMTCDCGCVCSKSCFASHKKTMKHTILMMRGLLIRNAARIKLLIDLEHRSNGVSTNETLAGGS